MRGATTYRNANSGVEVHVTLAAERLLGAVNVPGMVKLLTELCEALKANWAYLGKKGQSIDITVYSRSWGTAHMTVERGSA